MENTYFITKTLIIATCCLFLITGCVITEFQHKLYSNGKLTESIQLNHFKANVSDSKEGVSATFSDGTTFGVDKVTTLPDPNSATAIGHAIGEVLKGAIR